MKRFDSNKEVERLEIWLMQMNVSHSNAMAQLKSRLGKKLDPGFTVNLMILSAKFSNQGNLEILKGNGMGWEDLRKGFEYSAWERRILAGFQDLGKYGWSSLVDFCPELSFAMAFRIDSFATWLGDRMVRSFRNQEDKYRIGPPSPYYLAFLQFFSLWRDNGFDIEAYTSDSLGVYQEILDSWKKESALAKALTSACEYHLAQMDEEEGYSEFLGAPQDLLPVEILMIRRIREDQGLPNPEIDHPLMKTPLANPPKTLPEVHDELLDQVIAKARAELPIGDPW